ncbi:MAG: hypothetical protein ACMUJM_02105 [bacterium]
MDYKSCMRLVTILICSFTFCIICTVHEITAQILENSAVMNGGEAQINLGNDTEDVSQSDEDPEPSRSVGKIWNMPSPYLTTIPDSGSNTNSPVKNDFISQLPQNITGIGYDISLLFNPEASLRSAYTTSNSGYHSFINDYGSYPIGAPIGYEGYKVGYNSYVTNYADYAKFMSGYNSYRINYTIGYNNSANPGYIIDNINYSPGYVEDNSNYLGNPFSSFGTPGSYGYPISSFETPGGYGYGLFSTLGTIGSYRYEYPSSNLRTAIRSTPGPW